MRIYLKVKEYPEDTEIGNSKADIQKGSLDSKNKAVNHQNIVSTFEIKTI